ncbi:MAG TPA: aminotransferase class I/II-fold pyridoxal phosphate-dependent enzyme [Candidatus Limiplasma sp.]|nr:aminotransferase class I/II-fold pyridoxal phosphate-dependent enzyme [Candidatus Limiplasma sp.]
MTDDLFKPTGAILEAETLLANSAKANASFLLSGGSTAGIHAMILYACKRGNTLILPRNSHLSALNICAIAGIEPVFAELTELPGGYMMTTPDAFAKALDAHPQAKAILAISSDYYGLMSDLPAIADIAHANGKLLLCDEAHGAYFNWRQDLQNAGQNGADLFVQSAHKTLPAVNAAAWLHASDRIDTEKLRSILRMVQTSSPSFALMQAMDDARAWMDGHGQDACTRLQSAVDSFLLDVTALGFTDDRGIMPFDRLRLVLRSPQGGEWLQKKLEKLGIDVEMWDAHRIVCILSLLDGERRLEILRDALKAIAAENHDTVPVKSILLKPDLWPERAMPLHEAAFAEYETLAPEDAVGRISASTVGIYPPGTAWLTAGDIVTEEIAGMILETPAHRLFGMSSGIRCVK